MEQLLRQPGYIGLKSGAQKLRNLYQDISKAFDGKLLNRFAMVCYLGSFKDVLLAVQSGQDLSATETPYRFGYCTLVVAGAQRMIPYPGMDHLSVLKFLLERGAPPDVEDIVGYTALHHATMNHNARLDLARLLLEKGANVNHRNRYGEIPIMSCFQTNQVGSVELLMEFGADLDIADADGIVPREFFVRCGPCITATVTKCLRKRTGEDAPMDEKKCHACGKKEGSLKQCGKCHSTRYCSSECQRKDWPAHKKTCSPFSATNTVTLRPVYREIGELIPISDMVRQMMGIPAPPTPARNTRMAHVPNPRTFSPSQPKSMIIKVQVPFAADMPGLSAPLSTGDLLIYNKKRDFVCSVQYGDDRQAYKRISEVVRTKGVGGAKAYFPAELKSKDELVVKIDEVLAEQPF
ncbi:hypothetical protein C8Q75DRAFT_708684 [Abortiporus biennis]|nr:hypothetical protein C8Q75DRAFT_708684 [Abortiporus biennis]